MQFQFHVVLSLRQLLGALPSGQYVRRSLLKLHIFIVFQIRRDPKNPLSIGTRRSFSNSSSFGTEWPLCPHLSGLYFQDSTTVFPFDFQCPT